MCYCYPQKRGKGISAPGRKTLGIKVLPKKEFTEQEKISEEKIQAQGGATCPADLAARHTCQGSWVPRNPLGVGEPVTVKNFSWVECS